VLPTTQRAGSFAQWITARRPISVYFTLVSVLAIPAYRSTTLGSGGRSTVIGSDDRSAEISQ